MNKTTFYTPKITEFYIGFEYEVLKGDNWIKCSDFSNEYEHEDSPLHGLIKDLENSKIRVRHLDPDEIISLGFGYSGADTKDSIHWYNKLGNFKIINWLSDEIIINYDSENHFLWIFAMDKGKANQLFQGVIKNKSELNKILTKILPE